MGSLSRSKEARSQEASKPIRLRQARSLWLIWFVLFMWFIWFIGLVPAQPKNQIDQTNQITVFLFWRAFQHPARRVFVHLQ